MKEAIQEIRVNNQKQNSIFTGRDGLVPWPRYTARGVRQYTYWPNKAIFEWQVPKQWQELHVHNTQQNQSLLMLIFFNLNKYAIGFLLFFYNFTSYHLKSTYNQYNAWQNIFRQMFSDICIEQFQYFDIFFVRCCLKYTHFQKNINWCNVLLMRICLYSTLFTSGCPRSKCLSSNMMFLIF